ncbi:MAG: rhodanese-like domain-containing protein [Sphingobacteriia bacterium]|nr:rhodanese-like domain-containing protein [Sphingobacteriia bacterium]
MFASNKNSDPNMQVKETLPEETYEILQHDKDAYLIDVRTDYEWENVGHPDLTKAKNNLVKLSWRTLPQMVVNTKFSEELEQIVSNKDSKLFFICRAGGRSYEAATAAIKSGFLNSYNVIGGFEGHGEDSGWKFSNLPWRK